MLYYSEVTMELYKNEKECSEAEEKYLRHKKNEKALVI